LREQAAMPDHLSMRKFLRMAVTVAATCGLGIVAAAEAPTERKLLKPPKMSIASPITDRLAVNIRFYMPTVATDLRDDASNGTLGTPLTGEGTLGLQNKLHHGSIDLQFRMVDRHRIRAQFYKQTRNGDVVLNQQLRFGDDVYIVNDRVISKMDLRKLDLAYTYSFLRRETIELSAGLAIHLLQAEGTLDAPARFVSEQLDVAGPFATLAFDGTWRFMKRFSLNAQVNYLKGHVSDVRGSYKAWNADLQFRVRPNFTLGAGYAATRFFLESSDPGSTGLFRFDYKGPQAFIRVSL
jgi:hypothetical protein